MAKLIIPTEAYKVTSGRPGKWHLRRSFGDQTLTACGFIIWDNEPEEENPIFADSERCDILEIPAKDICKKCLGAMKAED